LIFSPSSSAKPTSANRLDDSAMARAPSSRESFAIRMERNRIMSPPVVPMKPIGGRMLAYIEMGRAY
jgi:hypothetical protein